MRQTGPREQVLLDTLREALSCGALKVTVRTSVEDPLGVFDELWRYAVELDEAEVKELEETNAVLAEMYKPGFE